MTRRQIGCARYILNELMPLMAVKNRVVLDGGAEIPGGILRQIKMSRRVVKGTGRTQQERLTQSRANTGSQLNWLRLFSPSARGAVTSERFNLFRQFSDRCKLFQRRHILPKHLVAHPACPRVR